MRNFESQPEELHKKEQDLMGHEITPTDRLQNQIVLATELFKQVNPDIEINGKDREDRNRIMQFWSEGGDESYSRAYRLLENDPYFKTHPRLQGNIFKITADDVDYYLKNKKLPNN